MEIAVDGPAKYQQVKFVAGGLAFFSFIYLILLQEMKKKLEARTVGVVFSW